MAIAHASNRLGYTVCGARVAGQRQLLTEKYPSLWEDVTCAACKAKETPARVVDAKNRCRPESVSLDSLRSAYSKIVVAR